MTGPSQISERLRSETGFDEIKAALKFYGFRMSLFAKLHSSFARHAPGSGRPLFDMPTIGFTTNS